MPTRLYLMRHGETLFNTQGRVQGACDSPLTEKGCAQAQLARAYFEQQGIHFDAVYASTQERATDTAKLVAGHDQVTQLKGIKEMNFGVFEAQPEFLLPKFRPGASSFEDLLVPYGGEAISEVGQRVRATIDQVLAQTSAQTLLMVSHGAAMWGLIQRDFRHIFPQGVYFTNCAICEFEWVDQVLALKRLILVYPELKIYDIEEA